MELEITWKRTLILWWAFFWRNLFAILASHIIGYIIGLIVSVIGDFLGADITTILWLSGSLGVTIGLLISIIPLKMILGKDFGQFRLVLLSKKETLV
jgi:hypothetical protein